MKKMFLCLLSVFLVQFSFPQTITIHKTDQSAVTFQLSQIDSITFSLPTSPGGYTSDFLAWTGSDDAAHYFTLVRIDGKNGTVTNIGGDDFFSSIKYSPDGTLYGIANDLHIINPTNGSTVKIGDFYYQSQNKITMGGAAFSTDGTLYVVALSDSVFTVNLSNAALTYVGKPTAAIWDLEFASDGTLYGAFANLFILDPSNMSTLSTVGPTGAYICPLALGDKGKLFGMDIYPSTNIYSLNLTTGHAAPITTVGSTGLTSFVVERIILASKITQFNVAANTYGPAAKRTEEKLLNLEKAVKQSYSKKFNYAK